MPPPTIPLSEGSVHAQVPDRTEGSLAQQQQQPQVQQVAQHQQQEQTQEQQKEQQQQQQQQAAAQQVIAEHPDAAAAAATQARLDTPQQPPPLPQQPAFSPADTTVIFVLGGPGAGKGTQCAYLVRDYGFVHLSAGDLLRAEQERPGSEYGELIRRCIKEGNIVPMEVTVALLEKAMRAAIAKAEAAEEQRSGVDGGGSGAIGGQAGRRFLIDGFPRKMDQALHFEAAVCPARFAIFFDCPLDVLLARLLQRGLTSGRADDNLDSIRKRFRTFEQTSMPVVEHYARQGRVLAVDAARAPDEVHGLVRRGLVERGIY